MDRKQYKSALRNQFPDVSVKNEPHGRVAVLIPKTTQSPYEINPHVKAVREFAVECGLELKFSGTIHPYCDVYRVCFDGGAA